MPTLADNKATVIAFLAEAFGGEPDRAVELYLADDFIEHNAVLSAGREAFATFARGLNRDHPHLALTIETVVAEDDIVVTRARLRLNPDEPEIALADFFRLEAGRIIEHWDVVQR